MEKPGIESPTHYLQIEYLNECARAATRLKHSMSICFKACAFSFSREKYFIHTAGDLS